MNCNLFFSFLRFHLPVSKILSIRSFRSRKDSMFGTFSVCIKDPGYRALSKDTGGDCCIKRRICSCNDLASAFLTQRSRLSRSCEQREIEKIDSLAKSCFEDAVKKKRTKHVCRCSVTGRKRHIHSERGTGL